MKVFVIKCIVLMQFLTITVCVASTCIATACVGKEFVAKKDAGADAGKESTGTPRSEDYTECCVLDHACMIQLESEKPDLPEQDASIADTGITSSN